MLRRRPCPLHSHRHRKQQRLPPATSGGALLTVGQAPCWAGPKPPWHAKQRQALGANRLQAAAVWPAAMHCGAGGMPGLAQGQAPLDAPPRPHVQRTLLPLPAACHLPAPRAARLVAVSRVAGCVQGKALPAQAAGAGAHAAAAPDVQPAIQLALGGRGVGAAGAGGRGGVPGPALLAGAPAGNQAGPRRCTGY